MNQQKGNNEVMPLAFNGIALNPVMRNGQIWMTASDLAKALDYSDVRSITKIHSRNANEFTSAMTLVVKLTTKGFGNGNSEKDTRIFSLRGCHLIAMMARTKVAKDFRVWVLDILDSEVGAPVAEPTPISVSNADWTRYLQSLTIPEMAQLTNRSEQVVISSLYEATHTPEQRSAQQPTLPNLPPQVQTALDQFWDTVSQLDLQQINHSRDPQVLAISLPEIYSTAGEQLPQRRSMLSALKHSLIPQFKDSNHAINSTITGSTKKCWVFVMPNTH
ncbi:Bro-N domain-containing protein [Psychrobacter sp. KCTC 72983]|uniref:BRO-N domain-containing protein n=1 Tax=Psychrobacter sp. KCTC 72983 TaxID=2733866 RepID=UPI001E4FE4AA|nr:BRO family protein [Psychrobacter sp. KCTC 72983]